MAKINLFWYRSKENFSKYINCYLHGCIHFSTWKILNDPMEGYFSYFPQYNDINALVSEKNKYKICCFSKRYSNFLLWSHYAIDHRGVCLEYEINVRKLPPNIKKRCVIYREEIPQFDDSLPVDKQAINFLTHKLIFWKHEEEIRLLQYDGASSDIEIGMPKSITFGFRFFEDGTLADNTYRDSICNKIREFRASHGSGIELYSINNVRPNGELIRTVTNRLG